MLRAIIIDDEQSGISSLEMLIELYVPDLKVVRTTKIPERAVELISDFKPEIVFLDINMPDTNGFELLQMLNWRNFNLVFTTAHQQYAIKALRNNAFDYLLKPIDHEELLKTVERVRQKVLSDSQLSFDYALLQEIFGKSQRNKILIWQKTSSEYVELQEIIFMEAKSNYTEIHMNDRCLLTPSTLKEFESELCTEGNAFMRVHNSYIINLNHTVRYIRNSDFVVMKNNHKIPIAKSRRGSFLNWLEP